MRLVVALLALFTLVGAAVASDQGGGVLVYGGNDNGKPGWGIMADVPQGWTSDCCTYAKAIGVNLVLYQGEWTGKPERVVVLNVWDRTVPTLQAELDTDRKQYMQRDPKATVESLPITTSANMTCSGVFYRGSDHEDDAVVFCEPPKASGLRLSWSMTVADADPERSNLLKTFARIAGRANYMACDSGCGSTQKANGH
jgi:hypothetical protein